MKVNHLLTLLSIMPSALQLLKKSSGYAIIFSTLDAQLMERYLMLSSMVEKLKLPIKNLPHPYKLTWLKKGNDVKVTKKCLVDFSIGNIYHDNVWCYGFLLMLVTYF